MRGQLIPRGEKKFLLRIFLGRDAAGKRKYSSKTFDGTVSQAKQELTRMLAQVDAQTFVEPSKITVGVYLSEWLKGLVDVRESTARSYREIVDRYLAELGYRRLDQLTLLHVQQHYAGLTARGLSASTVQYAHRVLHHALEDACQQGFLLRNPSEYAKLPRRVRQETQVLSGEQIRTLLTTTQGDEWNSLWTLLLSTGLRPSEARALRWTDFDGSRIMVRFSIEKGEAGREFISELKTEKSRRSVPLPLGAITALSRHRAKQAQVILKAGAKYTRNDFIFANAIGGFLDLANMRRHWKAALKQAGLPPVKLYGARHSHITHLLELGEHPKIASERAGHSSVSFTMDVYTHVQKTMQDEMVSRLEVALG